MKPERILILVKTYPQLSKSYGETVCTAGIRGDGSWVRIYPVPFRRMQEGEQYRKFDWLSIRLRRNTSDPRPESFRPYDVQEFHPQGHVDTARRWAERRRLVLDRCRVYTTLAHAIADAQDPKKLTSLAVFRPTKVTDFVVEEDERSWKPARLEEMRNRLKQGTLFDDAEWRQTFQVVDKLPYKFSYRFEDDVGRASELQILDWEIGALYWNCLRACDGDEQEALAKVRVKYFEQFLETDLHFFLGTTLRWHSVAPNPWTVIGVFPIPNETQLALF